MADPVSQRGSIQLDALPGIDLNLAVQRQVVGIFRHQNLGDRRFGRQAALNQTRRRRGLYDTVLASPAGVFGPPGDKHPELRRHDIQPLAFVLANPMQFALATGAGPVVDIDDDLDPRQMRRQRAAIGASLLGPCGSFSRSRLIRCRSIARRRLLDVLLMAVQKRAKMATRAGAEVLPPLC